MICVITKVGVADLCWLLYVNFCSFEDEARDLNLRVFDFLFVGVDDRFVKFKSLADLVCIILI